LEKIKINNINDIFAKLIQIWKRGTGHWPCWRKMLEHRGNNSKSKNPKNFGRRYR